MVHVSNHCLNRRLRPFWKIAMLVGAIVTNTATVEGKIIATKSQDTYNFVELRKNLVAFRNSDINSVEDFVNCCISVDFLDASIKDLKAHKRLGFAHILTAIEKRAKAQDRPEKKIYEEEYKNHFKLTWETFRKYGNWVSIRISIKGKYLQSFLDVVGLKLENLDPTQIPWTSLYKTEGKDDWDALTKQCKKLLERQNKPIGLLELTNDETSEIINGASAAPRRLIDEVPNAEDGGKLKRQKMAYKIEEGQNVSDAIQKMANTIEEGQDGSDAIQKTAYTITEGQNGSNVLVEKPVEPDGSIRNDKNYMVHIHTRDFIFESYYNMDLEKGFIYSNVLIQKVEVDDEFFFANQELVQNLNTVQFRNLWDHWAGLLQTSGQAAELLLLSELNEYRKVVYPAISTSQSSRSSARKVQSPKPKEGMMDFNDCLEFYKSFANLNKT